MPRRRAPAWRSIDTSDPESVRFAEERWGIHLPSFDEAQKAVWERQERFLTAYSQCKTIGGASEASNVHRTTVHLWTQRNILGFAERRLLADQYYHDWLENRMTELIEGLKPGQNPLPLIARLNAEMPDKYKRNVEVYDDTPKKVLSALVKLSRLAKTEEAKALPESTALPIERMGTGSSDAEHVIEGEVTPREE